LRSFALRPLAPRSKSRDCSWASSSSLCSTKDADQHRAKIQNQGIHAMVHARRVPERMHSPAQAQRARR
jgi:hypothetical protein